MNEKTPMKLSEWALMASLYYRTYKEGIQKEGSVVCWNGMNCSSINKLNDDVIRQVIDIIDGGSVESDISILETLKIIGLNTGYHHA